MPIDTSQYNACKKLSQDYGALAYVLGGCAIVYGKVIPITDTDASIQEGAEITNFNFHVNGNRPALPSPEYSPAPVEGYNFT